MGKKPVPTGTSRSLTSQAEPLWASYAGILVSAVRVEYGSFCHYFRLLLVLARSRNRRSESSQFTTRSVPYSCLYERTILLDSSVENVCSKAMTAESTLAITSDLHIKAKMTIPNVHPNGDTDVCYPPEENISQQKHIQTTQSMFHFISLQR